MDWRDGLPKPPDQFDPTDSQQVEDLLKMYKVKITAEESHPKLQGWSSFYKGGAGLTCPFLNGDKDRKRSRAVIALSVYLHIVGVDAGLCDTLAYWFIEGPVLTRKLRGE